MSLKIYRPNTSARRGGMSVINYKKYLTKKKPEKSLTLSLKRTPGRDRFGRVSVRHKGGGEQRAYRLIDFRQNRLDIPAKVLSIEYDPNRSGFIALIEYEDHQKSYILAPQDLKVGDSVITSMSADIKVGNRTALKNIPTGTLIHNIELVPGQGGKLIRSAGGSAQVLSREEDGRFVQVKMPSGEVRRFLASGLATIGQVSNPLHSAVKIGKAGRVRHMGVRPTVRGVAMYPSSHPHGGGEGKSPVGMTHPKTPWGKPARGVKTRKRTSTDRFIVKRRK
jgi:large subunit ribosomal protein L2